MHRKKFHWFQIRELINWMLRHNFHYVKWNRNSFARIVRNAIWYILSIFRGIRLDLSFLTRKLSCQWWVFILYVCVLCMYVSECPVAQVGPVRWPGQFADRSSFTQPPSIFIHTISHNLYHIKAGWCFFLLGIPSVLTTAFQETPWKPLQNSGSLAMPRTVDYLYF